MHRTTGHRMALAAAVLSVLPLAVAGVGSRAAAATATSTYVGSNANPVAFNLPVTYTATVQPAPTIAPSNVGAPAVTVTQNGSQLVFYKGVADHLYEVWFTAGYWYGPLDLTAGFSDQSPLQSAPSATVTPDGSTVLVFWRGAAGHLFEAWYTGHWNGPVDWTATAFGGTFPLSSAPTVATVPDGTQQLVYWRGPGNHLDEAWWANSRWNGPVDILQYSSVVPTVGDPSATVVTGGPGGRGIQLVFWQGGGGHLFEAWYAGHWNGPVDWTAAAFGGAAPMTSAPTVATTPDGTQQLVYWRGAANHLFEAWWAGSRWNGPVDLTSTYLGGGGLLSSAPAAALTADGSTQLVFWQGAGQKLWQAWYTGRWNGPYEFGA
jgi:hypothetical protein